MATTPSGLFDYVNAPYTDYAVGNSVFTVGVQEFQRQVEIRILALSPGVIGGGLADPGSNGILVRTATGVTVSRQMANASSGLTWTNATGVGGDMTPVFANDLGALEALSGTGFSKRTGTDTWILTSLTSADVGLSNVTNDAQVKRTEMGVALGVATLDGAAKIPLAQIPDTVVGAVDYQGTWNASTNSPNLGSLSPSKGDYYVVSADGTTSLGGITDWKTGDWAIYNGAVWQKVDNTDQVSSVFGRQGTVTAISGDYSFSLISGTAQINQGGTGQVTALAAFDALSPLTTQGDLLYFDGTHNARLAKNTSATRYLSNTGTSNNPSWTQVDLTNGVTGTLPVESGGVGIISYTVGDLLYASATTTLSKLADVTTGNALISGGVSTAPAWGKIGLTTHISGILPEVNGGTNQSTYTTGDLLYASATNTLNKRTLIVPSSGVVNFLGVVSGDTVPSWKSASSNPGAAASILATDASGYLTTVRHTVTDYLFVNTSVANIYLKDTSTGWQSSTSLVINPQANNSLQTTNFTSGLVGWSWNATGDAEANNLTLRGALRSAILLYNAVLTTAGTQLITPSAGKLKTDFTIPASPTYGSTDFVIDVVDQDGLTHAASQLFAINDIIYLKDGISGYTYFKISAVSDQTTFWRYTATIQCGTNNITYRAGLGIADFKQSGAGFIIQTADQANAPYIQMATHAGTFSSMNSSGTLVVTPQLRVGNLNGSYGYAADTYGLGAGTYGVSGKSWITAATDGGGDAAKSGIRLGNNTSTLIHLRNDGSGFFANNNIAFDTLGNTKISSWSINSSSITNGGITLKAATLPTTTTATAFGDSITKGTTGPSDLAHSYAVLTASAMGWTLTNTAVDGAQAADIADQVYAVTVSGTSRAYWLAVGVNDERTYLTNTGKRDVFKYAHLAELAWLAIPDSAKIKGTNAAWTYAGTWSNTSAYGLGKNSSTVNDTATVTVSGTVIYFASIIQDGQTGVYTIKVDGVLNTTGTTVPGGTISTVNGRNYAPKLYRISGLASGSHTIEIKLTSGSPVYVDWITGNEQAGFTSGPPVYVCNTTKLAAAGYVTYGGSVTNTAAYNDIISANIATLVGDGLNLTPVDFFNAIDPTTDIIGDGVHINDAGNIKLKNALVTATGYTPYNRIYMGIGSWNNSNTSFYVDGAGMFSLKDKLSWDGSTLNITGNITATTGNIAGWDISSTALYKGTTYIASGLDIPSGQVAWFGKSATGYQGWHLKSTAGEVIQCVVGNSILKPYLYFSDSASTFRIVMGEMATAWGSDGASTGYGMKIWDASGNRLVEFSDTRNAIGGWTISSTKISSTGIDIVSGGSAYLAFGTTPPTASNTGTGIFLDRTGLYSLTSSVQNLSITSSGLQLYPNTGSATSGSTVKWDSAGNWGIIAYGLSNPIGGSRNSITVQSYKGDTVTHDSDASTYLVSYAEPSGGGSPTGCYIQVASVAQFGGFGVHSNAIWMNSLNGSFAGVVIGANEGSGPNATLDVRGSLLISSTSTFSDIPTIAISNSDTTSSTDFLKINHLSSGTPGTNFGTGILFNLQSSTTTNRNAVRLQSIWTTASDASRTSALLIQTVNSASSLTEVGRFAGNGDFTVTGNVFLSSGKKIDWNSGDVTVTHSSDTLTFAGAASGYVFNSGNVGIGTSPSALLHLNATGASTIRLGSGTSTNDYGRIDFYGKETGDQATIGYLTFNNMRSGSASLDAAIEVMKEGASADEKASIQFATHDGSSLATRLRIYSSGGVVIGSPTGGDKGSGSLNAVTVWRNGTSLDTVFESSYKLMSLDELSIFVKNNHYLPTIPTNEVHQGGSTNIGALGDKLWETTETQTLYILQLHERIKVLEAQLTNG